jgi:hypothetical protein
MMTGDATDPDVFQARKQRQMAKGVNGNGCGTDLAMQAKTWAGPAAQNHKGSSEGSIIRQDGKSRADLLHYQAEQFFHPPSSPARPIAGGSTSSTDGPNSNQPSVRRKLNPIFVEALMRWPTGLSGFERPEMVSIPSLLPTHFCVCKRGCPNERSEDLRALLRHHGASSEVSALSMGQAALVRQGLHGRRSGAGGTELPAMRDDIPPGVQPQAGASVLLDRVREHRKADQGPLSESTGRREGAVGASGREGAPDRASVTADRDCAPRGPSKAEQRSGEPHDHDQLSALARAHERQPACAPLSALDVWWLLMPSYLSALYSTVSEPEQASLF